MPASVTLPQAGDLLTDVLEVEQCPYACRLVKQVRPSLYEQITGEAHDAVDLPFATWQSDFTKMFYRGLLRSALCQHALTQRVTSRSGGWVSTSAHTHTMFSCGKWNVGPESTDLFLQLVAKDCSRGLVHTLIEVSDADSGGCVFFDIDMVLPSDVRFEEDDWRRVCVEVQRAVLLYYEGALDGRAVLSLAPPLSKPGGHVKHAAHVVFPGLRATAAQMKTMTQLVVERLLSGTYAKFDWDKYMDTSVYRRCALRMNGSFKCQGCDECRSGSHRATQALNQCYMNRRKPMVFVDGAKPWRTASNYSVDLLANDVRCYTVRFVLAAAWSRPGSRSCVLRRFARLVLCTILGNQRRC